MDSTTIVKLYYEMRMCQDIRMRRSMQRCK